MEQEQKIRGWTLKERLLLADYLSKGYRMKYICDIWKEAGVEKVNYQKILKEVNLGLSDLDRELRRYLNYDPLLVYERVLGVDLIEYIRSRAEEEKNGEQ